MPVVLIDANIYLDFYCWPDLAPLIGAIRHLEHDVYVPEQVVDEVLRNRLRVAASSLAEQYNELAATLGVTSAAAQPLYVGELATRVGEAAGASAALRRDLDAYLAEGGRLRERLAALIEQDLADVSAGRDVISTALAPIFQRPERASDAQLHAARARRELGSAPGRSSAPLGDQLIWLQFVEANPREKVLWVVTADHDYFSEFHGRTFLNSALYQELRACNDQEGTDLRLFTNLAEALFDFIKARALPLTGPLAVLGDFVRRPGRDASPATPTRAE